jgi:hypothetical protein
MSQLISTCFGMFVCPLWTFVRTWPDHTLWLPCTWFAPIGGTLDEQIQHLLVVSLSSKLFADVAAVNIDRDFSSRPKFMAMVCILNGMSYIDFLAYNLTFYGMLFLLFRYGLTSFSAGGAFPLLGIILWLGHYLG